MKFLVSIYINKSGSPFLSKCHKTITENINSIPNDTKNIYTEG